MDEDNAVKVEKKPNSFWEFVKAVIISVLIVVPIRAYVAQPFIVDGSSMEPNFYGGEYLIIDELTYQFREPQRGDVIVFRYPKSPSTFFIKRIIGLPEETVAIQNSSISITSSDGRRFLLAQPYIAPSITTGPDETITLKDGEYFVLGDNREHSSDSRLWGVLPRKNITGRALVRLWPVTALSFLPNY